MNDRFKFRAWEPLNKKMYDMEFCLRDGRLYALSGDQGMSTAYCSMDLDSLDVMQSTGLRDKTRTKEHPNGKLIFEGDIVLIQHPHKNRKWQGSVYWDGVGWNGHGFNFSHFDDPNSLFSEGTEFIEIIGDIHQNPELIIEQKKEQ